MNTKLALVAICAGAFSLHCRTPEHGGSGVKDDVSVADYCTIINNPPYVAIMKADSVVKNSPNLKAAVAQYNLLVQSGTCSAPSPAPSCSIQSNPPHTAIMSEGGTIISNEANLSDATAGLALLQQAGVCARQGNGSASVCDNFSEDDPRPLCRIKINTPYFAVYAGQTHISNAPSLGAAIAAIRGLLNSGQCQLEDPAPACTTQSNPPYKSVFACSMQIGNFGDDAKASAAIQSLQNAHLCQ